MGNKFAVELQVRGKNKKGEGIALVSLVGIGDKSDLFDFIGLGYGKLKALGAKEGSFSTSEVDLDEISEDENYVMYNGVDSEGGCKKRTYFLSFDTLEMSKKQFSEFAKGLKVVHKPKVVKPGSSVVVY